jgi:hypothetical protein
LPSISNDIDVISHISADWDGVLSDTWGGSVSQRLEHGLWDWCVIGANKKLHNTLDCVRPIAWDSLVFIHWKEKIKQEFQHWSMLTYGSWWGHIPSVPTTASCLWPEVCCGVCRCLYCSHLCTSKRRYIVVILSALKIHQVVYLSEVHFTTSLPNSPVFSSYKLYREQWPRYRKNWMVKQEWKN